VAFTVAGPLAGGPRRGQALRRWWAPARLRALFPARLEAGVAARSWSPCFPLLRQTGGARWPCCCRWRWPRRTRLTCSFGTWGPVSALAKAHRRRGLAAVPGSGSRCSSTCLGHRARAAAAAGPRHHPGAANIGTLSAGGAGRPGAAPLPLRRRAARAPGCRRQRHAMMPMARRAPDGRPPRPSLLAASSPTAAGNRPRRRVAVVVLASSAWRAWPSPSGRVFTSVPADGAAGGDWLRLAWPRAACQLNARRLFHRRPGDQPDGLVNDATFLRQSYAGAIWLAT
jgi:hypothetical protein